ncbi:hypothetical protein DBV15_07145 [Temnothorax longispinosus]|uniref:Uncharacterized protein n=1 Tax=Temnothorax longispinosus TaxID=300112 RepID=A0A4S2L7C0_9HYME|nr:hypothetical protein DBV15_07145 [Temnothorax longispinosus]
MFPFTTWYGNLLVKMDLPDSHLQSAIRGDERKYTFRSTLSKCPSYLQPYLSTCPIPREHIQINSEYQYGNILSSVYNSDFKTLNWVKRHLPSAFEVSSRLVNQCLTSLIPGLHLPKIRSDEYISVD